MKIYQSSSMKLLIVLLFLAGIAGTIFLLLQSPFCHSIPFIKGCRPASTANWLAFISLPFVFFGFSYFYWKRGKRPLCEITDEGIRSGEDFIRWQDVEKAICHRGFFLGNSLVFVMKKGIPNRYQGSISFGRIYFIYTKHGTISPFEISRKQMEALTKELKLFVPVEEK